ncbi:MAG: HEPN domain-containing protein [Candidatus Margulisiibacteriota bacterium]
MKNNPSKVVLDWIKRADSDFGFAKAAFKEFDEFYSQMCILCHDAVEKYLKAYLVSRKKRYKRIHDLVTLLKDCANISENKEAFMGFEEGCRILNNYYSPLKYPSHFPFATQKQAKEAIEITEEIGKFIKTEIS